MHHRLFLFEEVLSNHAPKLLRKHAITISYHDDNRCNNVITVRLVTRVFHFVNKIPVELCSKKKAAVETATYGSEWSSDCAHAGKVSDLRITLTCLGVPLRKKSHVFRDRKSTVDFSTTPHSKIHKKHVASSFHRVRETIVAIIILCFLIKDSLKTTTSLGNQWSLDNVWCMLQPFMFW